MITEIEIELIVVIVMKIIVLFIKLSFRYSPLHPEHLKVIPGYVKYAVINEMSVLEVLPPPCLATPLGSNLKVPGISRYFPDCSPPLEQRALHNRPTFSHNFIYLIKRGRRMWEKTEMKVTV